MDLSTLHKHFLNSNGVSTDTREDLTDKLFFALKGENFDGNKYAAQALKKGATYAVVDDESLKDKDRLIWVEDVLNCLQTLATYHRKHLGLPIIGITGSNGKTTTKELIAAVLSQQYNIVFTRGNLNNHIGVPLTLLQMNENTEIGVVEMGANHQGEIANLSKIAQPDFGYITNFGKAHLEGFGGVEGVIKGKSELYDFLRLNEKTIFINADDPLEIKQSKEGHIYAFSQKKAKDCQVIFKGLDPYAVVGYQDQTIHSRLLGDYNAKNIAAAICVGQYFKIAASAIKKAIETYKPNNNRSQIIEKGANQIILDAYNANPTSMALAIKNFEQFPAKSRVVMIGDMFEVGKTAIEEHQHIVNLLEASTAIEQAFVCGESFAQTHTEKVKAFKTFEALNKAVKLESFTNKSILIKGSRGMAMERLLDVL